ncbi:MAG: cysteine synthase A [Clostridia bacterium]|nr:cysteine synthase A [Clostridia bacterium]
MPIYKSVSELVGRTPLVELCCIEKECSLSANLFAKLEYLNPAGSVKDRVAKEMIEDAESRGLLSRGSVIIEPTSGNTGIGLASIAASKGYRAIIVMPDTMSQERIKLMKAYGAEVVLTDGSKGMSGAVAEAEKLAASNPASFIAGQFTNPANAMAHYRTTGPEIYEDLGGKVDIFVSGVGTGGTISGVGRYLKGKNPDVRVVAVEPQASPLLSEGKAGAHKIQGIGANFVPEVLDTSIYDEIITVTADDAYKYARMLGTKEGILVGISSGAALCAAVRFAVKPENSGKNIVVLLPDTGDRYLSTELFE